MLGLIAEHTGQPIAVVEKDSRRDRWFTAQQAREYGFVDQVVAELDDVRPSRPQMAGLR